MSHPLRMFFVQSAIGFVVAAVFVAALLLADFGGLWRLVSTTPGGYLAVVVLWVLNGSVFAAVQFGVALTLLPQDEDRSPRDRPERRQTPIPRVNRR